MSDDDFQDSSSLEVSNLVAFLSTAGQEPKPVVERNGSGSASSEEHAQIKDTRKAANSSQSEMEPHGTRSDLGRELVDTTDQALERPVWDRKKHVKICGRTSPEGSHEGGLEPAHVKTLKPSKRELVNGLLKDLKGSHMQRLDPTSEAPDKENKNESRNKVLRAELIAMKKAHDRALARASEVEQERDYIADRLKGMEAKYESKRNRAVMEELNMATTQPQMEPAASHSGLDPARRRGPSLVGQFGSIREDSNEDSKPSSEKSTLEGDDVAGGSTSDERVARLEAELSDALDLVKRLQDDAAGVAAQNRSRAERLHSQIEALRAKERFAEEETCRLRLGEDEASRKHLQELEFIEQRFMAVQLSNVDTIAEREKRLSDLEDFHTAEMEEMQQQLFYTIEAKRIESVRLHDTKREFQCQEERHQRIVADFASRLQMDTGVKPPVFDSAVNDRLQDEVRLLEVERDELKNALELLQGKCANYVEQVQGLENEKARAEEERKNKFAARPPVATSEIQMASEWSLFSSLRCPSRAFGRYAKCDANFNHFLWGVVNASYNITALATNEELDIVRFSKKAASFWGPASLYNGNLVSLMSDQRLTEWMKYQVESTMVDAEINKSVSVRNIGCVEFRNLHEGGTIEGVVILAYAALRTHKQSAKEVVLIFDGASQAPAVAQKTTLRPFRDVGGRDCCAALSDSVGSDDIGPGDSVSCIGHR
mmetsp:Transcript_120892/g.341868  ORF Transcript_120892/g.341868 Transcript_120892/m.341868 type:complete len:713 (+) Transcript_120892:161-2299(+)